MNMQLLERYIPYPRQVAPRINKFKSAKNLFSLIGSFPKSTQFGHGHANDSSSNGENNPCSQGPQKHLSNRPHYRGPNGNYE